MTYPTRAPWATGTMFTYATPPFTGSARKLVLHTMEVAEPAWPRYNNGGGLPHMSWNPGGRAYRQHIPFDRSARTLRSPGVPRSPNINAGVTIQVEIAGFAAAVSDYPDSWYDEVALRVGWLCDNLGIPRSFPLRFTDSPNESVQVDWATWAATSGVVGHQHAPYNDHWDPGDIATRLAPRLADAPVPPKPGAPAFPYPPGQCLF